MYAWHVVCINLCLTMNCMWYTHYIFIVNAKIFCRRHCQVAPNRWQVSIWTNAGLVHWHINVYASWPGHVESIYTSWWIYMMYIYIYIYIYIYMYIYIYHLFCNWTHHYNLRNVCSFFAKTKLRVGIPLAACFVSNKTNLDHSVRSACNLNARAIWTHMKWTFSSHVTFPCKPLSAQIGSHWIFQAFLHRYIPLYGFVVLLV